AARRGLGSHRFRRRRTLPFASRRYGAQSGAACWRTLGTPPVARPPPSGLFNRHGPTLKTKKGAVSRAFFFILSTGLRRRRFRSAFSRSTFIAQLLAELFGAVLEDLLKSVLARFLSLELLEGQSSIAVIGRRETS